MDFLLDLILDGSILAINNKKLNKPIRYLLAFIICTLFVAIIALIIITAIAFLDTNLLASIFLFLLALFMVFVTIKRLKSYKKL